MRIGLMIGPERGRYRSKVERLRADARWAEDAGLASVWVPQIPDDFDALTAAALVGDATARIEVGTAVVPVQPRHPIAGPAGAVGAGRLRGPPVARSRRVPPLDHRRDAGAALRAPGTDDGVVPGRVGPRVQRSRPSRRRERPVPGPQPPRHHRRHPHSGPWPGHAPGGGRAHRRHDPLDGGRAGDRHARRPEHHARRRGGRAGGTGSWRASRFAFAATTRSRPPWPAPTGSLPRPRCRRTTSGCSTRATRQVGDLLAAGPEEAIEKRLRSFDVAPGRRERLPVDQCSSRRRRGGRAPRRRSARCSRRAPRPAAA